jgi:hypothetical protein
MKNEVVYLPCEIESLQADDLILVAIDSKESPLSIWVPREDVVIKKQPAPPERRAPLKGWVRGHRVAMDDGVMHLELRHNGGTIVHRVPTTLGVKKV